MAQKRLIPTTATDGSTSTLRVFRTAEPQAPVLVFLPAMGVEASYYDRLGESLSGRGVHVIAAELRGIGSSSVRASRRTDYGYRELVSLDCSSALAAAREIFPNSRIYLGGHSLGGQVSLLHLAREPSAAAGLVLVATCSVHHRGWRFPSSLRILLGTQLATWIARLWGYFPGHRLGFGGRQGRRVIAEWAHVGRTGRYEVQGLPGVEEALAELTAPVLCAGIEGDGLSPAAAIERLCAKIPQAQLERWTHAAPGRGNPHFRWARKPEAVAERIATWLGAREKWARFATESTARAA